MKVTTEIGPIYLSKINPIYFTSLSEIKTIDTQVSIINDDNGIYTKPFKFQELLGEEIATFMGRESIHYFLASKNNCNFLGSYSFDIDGECYPNDLKWNILYRKGRIYTNTTDFIPFFLKQSKSKESRDKFLVDLYQTFAIDLYMRQKDRADCNSMLLKDGKDLYFSPMYDYSDSFHANDSENYFTYENPFFNIDHNNYSIFLERYPEFLNYLNQAKEINLMKIIEHIKERYHFSYNDQFIEYWKNQEEISQKMLEKITK